MRDYVCDVARLLRLYGITQRAFAETVGVSKSTVSEWVSGVKTPKISRYGPILDAVEKLGNPEALGKIPIVGIGDLIMEIKTDD